MSVENLVYELNSAVNHPDQEIIVKRMEELDKLKKKVLPIIRNKATSQFLNNLPASIYPDVLFEPNSTIINNAFTRHIILLEILCGEVESFNTITSAQVQEMLEFKNSYYGWSIKKKRKKRKKKKFCKNVISSNFFKIVLFSDRFFSLFFPIVFEMPQSHYTKTG